MSSYRTIKTYLKLERQWKSKILLGYKYHLIKIIRLLISMNEIMMKLLFLWILYINSFRYEFDKFSKGTNYFSCNWFCFIIVENKWAEVLVMINNLLTILNSSFNFLIYLSFCGKQKKRRTKYTSTYLTTTTSVQQSAFSRENDSSRKALRK